MVRSCDDATEITRRSYAEALGQLGERAEPAVLAPTKRPEDRDADVRKSAADALGGQLEEEHANLLINLSQMYYSSDDFEKE